MAADKRAMIFFLPRKTNESQMNVGFLKFSSTHCNIRYIAFCEKHIHVYDYNIN